MQRHKKNCQQKLLMISKNLRKDCQPEEFEEILNIFGGETEEIIHKMNNNLLQLENAPKNKDLLIYLFRDAHSLKGAARMIGFNNIQRLAHKMEDVLGLAKENKLTINREISDALYKSTDILSDLIQQSVKQKREYYTDDIQKCIDLIDVTIKKYEIDNIEAKDENIPKSVQFSLQKEYKNINALFSEAELMLENLSGQAGSEYLETFCDLVKQLNVKFKETEYYDVKSELMYIEEKTDFVLHSSQVLTEEETLEIGQKMALAVTALNKIYQSTDLPLLNIDEKIRKKLDEEQSFESGSNDIITEKTYRTSKDEMSNKIKYLKEQIDNLTSDLSIIPFMLDAIDKITEMSQTKESLEIAGKLGEILEIIKQNNTLPQKEIVALLKQSVSSLENLNSEAQEKEDVTLVLQRLDITKQMLDLNNSINPLASFSAALDESSLPVKKAQDFFNSFETTSIKTLRVDSKKLDALVNEIGEIIIGRIKYKKNISELEQILTDLTELKNFNHKSQSFIKYYDKKYINNNEVADSSTMSVFSKQVYSIFQENSTRIIKLTNKITNILKNVDEEDSKLNLITTQLESMVKNIRVLPLATIFHMFPRMIRDISTDTGKDIELLISGSETSADKKVIEEIKSPLMHIIRNSIDHGIEPPQERIAAGKPPKGRIYLIAKNSQNKIIIEINDDGRGIDLKKIVKRALEKNIITQKEADCYSAEQIMNIIFRPGFSTEQVVTEISGRGVGLDIEKKKISQLNGTVKINSVPDKGTNITIELPISMSTLKAFIVKASNQPFALPMTAIRNVMWVKDEDIYKRNNTNSIIIDGKTVNLFSLSELMKLSVDNTKKEQKTVLLLEAGNGLMGIVVDKILGDQDILQK